jgi:hypothetical protein
MSTTGNAGTTNASNETQESKYAPNRNWHGTAETIREHHKLFFDDMNHQRKQKR